MISVCLATFNGEKYLKEQIDSIIMQLSNDDEVIVSDDGSSDKTLDILKSYQDPRIKIFNNDNRKGIIGNFENAINKSQGDFIFLADQDDIWLSNKVEKSLEYLKAYDLVISDCNIINENKEIINESFFKTHQSERGFIKNIIKNSYLGCCIAFKKEVKKYILPFPNRIAMHDIWIGLNVELNGSTFFIPEQLLLYRRHGNNASSSSEKSKFNFSYKILYRLQMLFYLLKRKYIHK